MLTDDVERAGEERGRPAREQQPRAGAGERQQQALDEQQPHQPRAARSQRRAQGHLPLDKLVLISQVDNAEQRQGNLYDQKATTDQQLTFAEQVESAKVITPRRSQKASAHSRNSSMAIGALIGLILGAIAAIVDGRPRSLAAPDRSLTDNLRTIELHARGQERGRRRARAQRGRR